MPQIKQKVSAIDKVDVAVVVVRPSMRPGVHNFKVIAAVTEVRPASDNRHVTDGEMVIVAKMLAEMFIVDAAMLFAPFLVIMPFFLPRVIAPLISVLILAESGHRRSQQKRNTDAASYQQSLHSDPRLKVLKPEGSLRAPPSH
jgi:hypothetical protein